MSVKVKYMVKCPFCDISYIVDGVSGEELCCPKCSGAASQKDAVKIIEMPEKEQHRQQSRRIYRHSGYSLSALAQEEEDQTGKSGFERMDEYETGVKRSQDRKKGSPTYIQSKEEQQEAILSGKILLAVMFFLLLSYIILMCAF